MLSRRTASGAIQESDVAKAKWICIVNFAARRRLRPGMVEGSIGWPLRGAVSPPPSPSTLHKIHKTNVELSLSLV